MPSFPDPREPWHIPGEFPPSPNEPFAAEFMHDGGINYGRIINNAIPACTVERNGSHTEPQQHDLRSNLRQPPPLAPNDFYTRARIFHAPEQDGPDLYRYPAITERPSDVLTHHNWQYLPHAPANGADIPLLTSPVPANRFPAELEAHVPTFLGSEVSMTRGIQNESLRDRVNDPAARLWSSEAEVHEPQTPDVMYHYHKIPFGPLASARMVHVLFTPMEVSDPDPVALAEPLDIRLLCYCLPTCRRLVQSGSLTWYYTIEAPCHLQQYLQRLFAWLESIQASAGDGRLEQVPYEYQPCPIPQDYGYEDLALFRIAADICRVSSLEARLYERIVAEVATIDGSRLPNLLRQVGIDDISVTTYSRSLAETYTHCESMRAEVTNAVTDCVRVNRDFRERFDWHLRTLAVSNGGQLRQTIPRHPQIHAQSSQSASQTERSSASPSVAIPQVPSTPNIPWRLAGSTERERLSSPPMVHMPLVVVITRQNGRLVQTRRRYTDTSSNQQNDEVRIPGLYTLRRV